MLVLNMSSCYQNHGRLWNPVMTVSRGSRVSVKPSGTMFHDKPRKVILRYA